MAREFESGADRRRAAPLCPGMDKPHPRMLRAWLVLCILVPLSLASNGIAARPCDGGVSSMRWDDADRNRIFDDLDAELQEQAPSWRRHVIVLLNEEPTPRVIGELKATTGHFRMTSYKEHPEDADGRPWTIIPAFAANLTKTQILVLSCESRVQQIEAVHPYALSRGAG